MPLEKREQLKGTRHVALASTKPPILSNFTKQPSPDPSLVVGIGAGALYMLISCHEEMKRLNKTVEQTEFLLLELREQLEHHCEDSPSSSCIESRSMQSADVRAGSSQGLHASMDRTGHRSFTMSNYCRDPLSVDHDSASNGMEKDEMAVLAAELEAELALMELNINEEDIILDESSIHEAAEVSWLQNSYYSDTSSHGIVEACNVERPSAGAEDSHLAYGVSAIELDHRLREILESQQQERILELEKLLKETEAKLLAKDLEILGWRNHVNSLASCFQHTPVCGTPLHECESANGAESCTSYENVVASVPEATRITRAFFHSFQDPPISSQANFVKIDSSVDFLMNFSEQETNLESFSAPVLPKEGNSGSIASCSLSPPFKGSLVRVSDNRHPQGTGIDTPDLIIMEKLDAHASHQMSRDHAVPKSVKMSDYTLPDQWSNDVHWSSYEHDSLLVDVDGDDAASSYVVPLSLHHIITKPDKTRTSPSSSDFGRTKDFDKDSAEVKHIVTSVKSMKILDKWSSGEEGMGSSKTGLKLKDRNPQIGTKGSRMSTFQEGSAEINSPVLDKIRLVGDARGKQI